MQMTSRERVKATLRHQEPDRVPLDLWGCASRLFDKVYFGVAKKLGLPPEGELIRPGKGTQYEDYVMADVLGSDFRHINIKKPDNYQSYRDENGNTIDEWGVGWKAVGGFMAVSHHPLINSDLEGVKKYRLPKAKDAGRIRGLKEQAEDWFHNTDKAITATPAVSGQFFDNAQFLRGTEQFLTDLYLEPELAHTLIDKITEYLIELNDYYLEPIAPYLEWIEFTSDLGTQNGPFLSKELFREFLLRPFSELVGSVKKKHPKLKVFLHSCGSIKLFIPDLIEAGIDVLNPLQPLARDMDSAGIKKEFGKDLVFHGAIDIQKAMEGSVEDVEQEVKKRIAALAPHGGYIVSPNNHLQNTVPPENVIALYQCAKEYGTYPLELERLKN